MSVFIPIIYAHSLNKLDLLISAIQCFIAFCIISSCVYIINDIIDIDRDRKHPIKNKRPIASGQVSIRKAIILAIILFAIGIFLTIARYQNYLVLLVSMLYILLNLAYSFFLKHYAIIDCFCIATGFVLRIYAGGAACSTLISEWLFLTMIAVSLLMAFGKRRGEMVQVSDNTTTRKVLASYSLPFINGMIFVFAGLSVVFYSLWAIANVHMMIYTVPLVIFIICKYLLIVYNATSHGDPTSIILGDKGLLVASGIFGLLSVILLYLY